MDIIENRNFIYDIEKIGRYDIILSVVSPTIKCDC